MPRAAVIYCRISKDAEGTSLGVKRQEKDCRALARRKGWPVVAVLVDDDVSAYVPGKRPAYARLLDGIKANGFDAVAVYDLDRLHRHPWELEEFFMVCDTAGHVALASVAGDYDLATNDGRMMARIMATVARKESDDKSRRLKSKHEELATRGRFSGGVRPYGYRPLGDGALEVVEAEAEVVWEAARRLLGGESPYGICADLNRRGVPTVKGAQWRTQTLRRILTSPTTAGYREHHGEVVGRAGWSAILDEITWRRLRAVIQDPTRARARAHPARSYLLSGGIARCGRCGMPLHAQRRQDGARVYACVPGPDKGGCGKISVRADPLEEVVAEAVMVALDGPELARAVARRTDDEDDGAGEEEGLEARLAELAEMWAAGEITRAEWLAARRSLEARLEAARRRQARRMRTTALDPYVGREGSLRAAWPSLTLDQRRAVVSSVLEQVTVGPAARRGPKFDLSRIDLVWRY